MLCLTALLYSHCAFCLLYSQSRTKSSMLRPSPLISVPPIQAEKAWSQNQTQHRKRNFWLSLEQSARKSNGWKSMEIVKTQEKILSGSSFTGSSRLAFACRKLGGLSIALQQCQHQIYSLMTSTSFSFSYPGKLLHFTLSVSLTSSSTGSTGSTAFCCVRGSDKQSRTKAAQTKVGMAMMVKGSRQPDKNHDIWRKNTQHITQDVWQYYTKPTHPDPAADAAEAP